MSTPFDFLKADAAAILTQAGLCAEAIYCTRRIEGMKTMIKRQDAATLSGLEYRYDFSMLFPASAFVGMAAPVPFRSHLEICSVSYLVIAVDTDVAGNVRVHLGARY